MIKLAVIADDLTGCNDTGLQFANAGLRTTVILEAVNREVFPDDIDVLVLDTESRGLDPASAYERVARVSLLVRNQGITRVYKKVDSTLRGNLGREIQAIDDVFNPDIVIIAPAFPQAGRTTIGGYHLLDGIPLTLTEIGADAAAPVKECHVVELLRLQTDNEVEQVPLNVVTDGVSAIRRMLRDKLNGRHRWFVFDVATSEDLRHIVEAASTYPKVLWVGSAGLAQPLPSILGWTSEAAVHAEIKPRRGPALVVAGSLSSVTKAQAAHFLGQSRAGLVKVNPVYALELPDSEALIRIEEALNLLRDGTDVLLTVESSPQSVLDALETGRRLGLSTVETGRRICETLGKTATRLAIQGLCGIFVTGGDTAAAVCRALGAGRISILREIVPAIPLGIVADGPHAGMRIATKAGAFGLEEAITQSVAFIRGEP